MARLSVGSLIIHTATGVRNISLRIIKSTKLCILPCSMCSSRCMLEMPIDFPFLQNSDFLAQKLTHLNRENFRDLSPVGLSNLVATFPGLDPMVARKIADHDIDGEAFLMLTQKVFSPN